MSTRAYDQYMIKGPFKTGDLVKFPDTGFLATIVNIETEYNTANATLWVSGDYTGPNPTFMSLNMLRRRAVVISKANK